MNVIISNKYESMLSTLNIEVIKSISGTFTVSEISEQFQNFFYNKMIIDITAIKNYDEISTIQQLSLNLDGSKIILVLDDSPKVNSPLYLSQLVSMGMYNFTKNINSVPFLIENPNQYKDVASYQVLDVSAKELEELKKGPNKDSNVIGQRIIGIRNLTDHAGSSTFTYLLKKHLDTFYTTYAVELDGNDLDIFEEEDVLCISSVNVTNFIEEHKDKEVIIIDLNDSGKEDICDEVILLIEPGIIPLNKMMMRDINIFDSLDSEKLVLNKSILSQREVEDFEKEAHHKVFFNIPYVDDKITDSEEIINFIIALGFTRFGDEDKKSSKSFGLFK